MPRMGIGSVGVRPYRHRRRLTSSAISCFLQKSTISVRVMKGWRSICSQMSDSRAILDFAKNAEPG